jgi:hypothetical protein
VAARSYLSTHNDNGRVRDASDASRAHVAFFYLGIYLGYNHYFASRKFFYSYLSFLDAI